MNTPQLIVMLTHDDYTVKNAREVFEQSRCSKAKHWGMKDGTLAPAVMRELYSEMKSCGMTTYLEVVDYSLEGGLSGARVAAECGCDVLLGTKYSDEVNDFCHSAGVLYMPFVGHVSGRPSVLMGDAEEMIVEAREYLRRGVYGIDLLGYRSASGDCADLSRHVVESLDAPVCLAGSIDSYGRLDEVRGINPWAFTIGSAFFDHRFEGSIAEQIDRVCDYMSR